MTRQEAATLVAFLEAAFPYPRLPEATHTLYVAEVADLANPEAAQAAIKALVRTGERLPTIAAVRDAYRTEARRRSEEEASTRGLPEPSECVPMPDDVRDWFKQNGIRTPPAENRTENVS